jgi:hypothetical protein
MAMLYYHVLIGDFTSPIRLLKNSILRESDCIKKINRAKIRKIKKTIAYIDNMKVAVTDLGGSGDGHGPPTPTPPIPKKKKKRAVFFLIPVPPPPPIFFLCFDPPHSSPWIRP